MPRDAIPAIPAVPHNVTDPQLRAHLQALRDAIQVRAHQTKNDLDYSPTVRELEEAGILKRYGSGLGSGGTELGPPDTGRPPPYEYPTIPLAPTGVTVRATPWYHHVTWDLTTEQNHYISDHGEVWTSDVNDRETAWLSGIGMLAYSVPVEPLAHRFYWVRYISHAGVEGYWSNDRFDGVEGISPPDPDSLRETLAGAITESELYETLNERLDYYGVSVDATQNQYTVKINNEGNIAGFGLIVDGEDQYNPLLGHSQFGVSADTFWVGAPGAEDFAFIVDSQNQRVVMDGAFISEGTITSAAIGDAAIDTFHLGDGTITTVKVENGAIENAKIGNEIRSYNFDPGNGIGWRLLKNGKLEVGEIVIYDDNGEIILASGPTGAAFYDGIDNSKVLFADLSDVPDHLEMAALLSMSVGGYGDLHFDKNSPNNGWVTIRGSRFYLPDGRTWDVTSEAGTGVNLFQQTGGEYNPGFLVYFHDSLLTRFSGWNRNGSNSEHLAICLYDNTLEQWQAYDGAATTYTFTPNDDNVIIATTWKDNPSTNGIESFNSFIGTNLRLPDDQATKTGHVNMVVDGDLQGLSNWIDGGGSTTNLTDNPWWNVSAASNTDVTAHIDNRVGRYVRLGAGSSPNWSWIQFPKTVINTSNDESYIKVAGGTPYYIGFQIYVYPGHGANTTGWCFRVNWYKNDKSFATGTRIDIRPPINSSTHPQSQFSFGTAVAVAPDDAAFARVQLINFSTGGDIAVAYAGMSRAPSQIGPEEAATFIRDAAIGTLQLAGTSVFVSEFVTNPNTVSAVNAGVYQLISHSFTVANLTPTTSFIVTVHAWGSATNTYEGGYGSSRIIGNQFRLEYNIGGGAWVSFYNQDVYVPMASRNQYADDPGTATENYYRGTVSIAAKLSPSQTGTKVMGFRLRANTSTDGNVYAGARWTDSALLVQVGKR